MLEGISYLLLLGVAMPLKYVAGMPMATKVTGWAHGALFVILIALLLHVWVERSWPLRRVAMVFAAALLPFGPFLIDRRLREAQNLPKSPLPSGGPAGEGAG